MAGNKVVAEVDSGGEIGTRGLDRLIFVGEGEEVIDYGSIDFGVLNFAAVPRVGDKSHEC